MPTEVEDESGYMLPGIRNSAKDLNYFVFHIDVSDS